MKLTDTDTAALQVIDDGAPLFFAAQKSHLPAVSALFDCSRKRPSPCGFCAATTKFLRTQVDELANEVKYADIATFPEVWQGLENSAKLRQELADLEAARARSWSGGDVSTKPRW